MAKSKAVPGLDLGISQEELREQVIERAAEKIADSLSERGEDTEALRKIRDSFQKELDKVVAETIEKEVLPIIKNGVQSLMLQETSKWGEKRGAALSFTEYCIMASERYLAEPVNFQGKSKSEANGYSWTGTQSRLTSLVHEHIHYGIETAMQRVFGDAKSILAKSLSDTCKLKLVEISESLKVGVTTKQ